MLRYLLGLLSMKALFSSSPRDRLVVSAVSPLAAASERPEVVRRFAGCKLLWVFWGIRGERSLKSCDAIARTKNIYIHDM